MKSSSLQLSFAPGLISRARKVMNLSPIEFWNPFFENWIRKTLKSSILRYFCYCFWSWDFIQIFLSIKLLLDLYSRVHLQKLSFKVLFASKMVTLFEFTSIRAPRCTHARAKRHFRSFFEPWNPLLGTSGGLEPAL